MIRISLIAKHQNHATVRWFDLDFSAYPFSRPEVKHKIKLAAERRRQSGYASPLKGKPWPEARRAAQQKGKAS
jgi:hypothetical protein